MSYQPDMNILHLCLACGETTLRVREYGWSNGIRVKFTCENPRCKSTGAITNIEPWYGTELPLEKLKAMFALAEIPIEDEPLKLENGYHNPSHMKQHYHCWWFVKTPRGWIEIGWRKRVMSIDWRHTDIRCIVTEDDLTKGEDHVHAYTEEKAIEYLKELWRRATTSTAHIDD